MKTLILFLAILAPLKAAAEVLPVQLSAGIETLVFADPVTFSLGEISQESPQMYGVLSASDAARLSDFTGRHLNEIAAFMVCGETIMAPRIMERIAGGRFVISGQEALKKMLVFVEQGCP